MGVDEIRMLALEQQRQYFSGRHALLAASWHVAANSTEDLCPFHGTETAGDFLQYLGHAQIILALIVG